MKNLLLLLFAIASSFTLNAQCLNGTYTIGGASPDYPTFNAALTAVVTNGVCGPVIFNVRPGTYNEQLNVPQVASVNAANTVTFQSENADSSSVILAYTSTLSTANYVLRLNGADYFRFSKLTLRATATAVYTRVIDITNIATYNIVSNCSIEGLNVSNTSDQFALVYSAGSNDNANSFLNNRMLNGSTAFVLLGVSTASPETGVIIDGNTLMGQYNGGMFLQYLSAPSVTHNSVFTTNLGNFLFYGVELYYCNGSYTIGGNNFLEGGIYVLNTNSTAGNEGLISNNFVQVRKSHGINLNTASNIHIYYNTILVNSGAVGYNALNVSNTLTGTTLRNNILCNGAGGYAINKSVQVISSNYNDLYTTGANLVFAAGNYATLSAWSGASGNDLNSVSLSPTFVSATDLHVQSAALDGVATPLLQVTDDIDGQTRNATTPDIGADEFSVSPDDAGVDAIASFCPGVSPVTVTLHNYGTATLTGAVIQWTVNAVAQPAYNWSGSLASGSSVPVTIGSYNFNTSATYTTTAWSEMPNAVTDPVATNDTTTLVTGASLSGAYTIGGAAPDFPTIDSAVNTLVARGVCGPAVFNIRPGTYTEQNVITAITGASSVNTITFQSENGDSASVDITYPATATAATNYVFHLQDADYIRFSKLTFSRTGAGGYGTIIRLSSLANNNSITNCRLLGQPTSINATNRVLIASDYSVDSGNVVRRNLIMDGYGGLYFGGNAPVTHEGNNDISQNVFTNQYAYAISCDAQYNQYIDSNTIVTNSAYTSSAAITMSSATGNVFLRGNTITGTWTEGIRFSYMSGVFTIEGNTIQSSATTGINGSNTTGNFIISKNNIDVPGTGLALNTCSGSAAPGVLISNNFFIGANGVNILYASYIRFYHNSIRANGPASTNYALQFYANTNDTVRNNIISNEGGGLVIRFWTYIRYEDNFYYQTGTTFGQNVSSGLFISYPQYITQALDNTSHFSLTPYVSGTDLHIYYKPDYFGVCTLSPGVGDDIDNNTRNVLYPWPGADEFMFAPNDAAATHVDPVTQATCSTSDPVIVDIQNAGGQPLTSVQINWSVDGILQTPYTWTGNLPSLQYQTGINIGSFTIATNTPNQLVKIWTSLPNGNPDTLNLFDTVYTYFTPKLSGVYTIGGSSPDYVSVDPAISDLLARGICGDVIFNIRPGTYSVTDTIYPVTGTGNSARITFQSENLDSMSVTLQSVNQNVIYLDSADYFTFNELTLQVIENFTPTTDCHPVRLAHGADHNRILNCRLIGDANINTSSYAGQFACLYSPGGCNYNLFRNNYMTGGLLGVYFSQYQATVPAGVNDTLDGNIIEVGNNPQFVYGYGMEIKNHDNLVVNGNTVTGWGCRFDDLDDAWFNANRFDRQILFMNVNDFEMRNNFTRMVSIGGTCDSIRVVHNTIAATTGEQTFAAFYLVAGVTNVVLENNIIANFWGGPAMDVYQNVNNWNYLTADHNDYYTTGSVLISSSGNYSLASWQAASGRDANSYAVNPPFLTQTDFHLTNSPQLSNGMPLPVPDDIDGDVRSATNPDIGADEFSPSSGNFDGAMADVAMQSQLCYGSQNVDVRIHNNETQVSLTSATINWKVNNVLQAPFAWTGVLAAGDTSLPITIGNYFFNGNTTYTIKAWISLPNGFSGLNVSNDSAQYSSLVLGAVALGNDTVVCEGNTLNINAGSFASYQWSTGSTASSITVSSPALYSVIATDSNGCQTSDTIDVDMPIADLGPDTTFCSGQTYVINAGYNFTGYSWSTGATSPTITVNTTGIYSLTGTGSNGCLSMDTVNVVFNPSPNVNLGNDTTICANAYITLDAGAGYTTYNWQPSATTGQTVLAAGGNFGIPEIYSVVVTNSFGCSGGDSILIYDRFDTIGVTCNGSSLILDGGSNYVTWAWSNSSGLYGTTQTVVVTVPDVYTVIALDANGCGVASQISITSITGGPSAGFSYSAAGQTITFNNTSGNSTTYNWNFGDTQTSTQQSPVHTYTTPGTYTVTLIAGNSCGSDTITQIITIVGIDEYNSGFGFAVSPNPAAAQFSVYISTAVENNFTLAIYDQSGRVVEERAVRVNGTQEIVFDMDLAPGVYFVELQGTNGRQVKRLIVE